MKYQVVRSLCVLTIILTLGESKKYLLETVGEPGGIEGGHLKSGVDYADLAEAGASFEDDGAFKDYEPPIAADVVLCETEKECPEPLTCDLELGLCLHKDDKAEETA
ncbi:uncharacterized protein LOC111713245 [Eurytemora carolleeae]|uniref:uncharacterized protein LOC111713245 n=1 Tax=Eurytemora carolleeae TaxID=1294199 RepID=UPI000C77FA1E|nr:uncharacterized protein LOC111713245 [Eurytemora carolleeae]|eukprot:XP_023343843.1 uncharacterized protein LOC111713245 [Eurytemora affinis]